jgi:hypothetical protein
MFLTTALLYAVTAVISRAPGVSRARLPKGRSVRNRRRLGRVLAGVFVAMVTAVPTVSASGTSDFAALPTPTPTPGAGATARAAAMSLPTPTPGAGATARAAATPVAGVVFGGFTSQGWPVVLEVPKGGKRIALAGIGLRMTCTSGAQPRFPDAFDNVRIAPNGNVNIRVTIPLLSGTPITGGWDSLSGRFDRRRSTFSGAWQLHLDYKFSSGPDHCDSGRVGFRARQ